MKGFRRPIRSDSQPEKMRSTVAVHSATPSITPKLATEALRVPVTNAGSTGIIISVDTSVNSEANPIATTLRRSVGGRSDGGDGGATAEGSVMSRPHVARA